jgi:hypothetical protein
VHDTNDRHVLLSSKFDKRGKHRTKVGSVHAHGNVIGIRAGCTPQQTLVDPYLPTWLPDLAVHDLRIGKHMLDIPFRREGEQTAFDVIKGDRELVERRDIASKDVD